MMIHTPVSNYSKIAGADVLFDLEKGELWINARHLPKQAHWHICLTTLELHRQEGKTYLPMEWCAYKWEGPKDLIEALQIRYQVEMAQLEDYREKHKPVEVPSVEAVECTDVNQPGSCDEHTGGWEDVNLCSTGTDGTSDTLCE